MSTLIKVGHAGSDENGGINGEPGESNGKEEVVAELYGLGVNWSFWPNIVLRPKKRTLAAISAKACEDACKNSNVGYGQNTRNTLYEEAKKVNYDISKITTKCNTDCSAFMTVCAIAGGASITYGTNAPTTRTMRERFLESGDYELLTGAIYTERTDYLKRGDILVDEDQHTVMVLENGSQVTEDSILKIALNMSDVNTTEAVVKANLLKIDGSYVQPELAEASAVDIALYTWKYTLIRLSNDIDTISITEQLQIKDGTEKIKFTLNNLAPGTLYSITLTASERKGTASFSSAAIIFYTKFELPTAITDLSVSFDKTTYPVGNYFTIKFNEANFPRSYSKTGYRIILFINGKAVNYNDTLVSSGTMRTILLSSIIGDSKIKVADTIQIGIQPWVKDIDDNTITDPTIIRCSTPICITAFYPSIAKIFIKIKDSFKRAILYNNK